MSLTFGGATSDRVEATLAGTATNLGPLTIWVWCYPTALTGGRRLFQTGPVSASPTGFRDFNVRNTGQLDAGVDLTTTNSNARSANSAGNKISANAWWFVAFTMDSSFVPRLYIGDLATTVAEVGSYTTQTTGVGSLVTEGGTPKLRVGNGDNNNLAFEGRIACVGYENTNLSLGQLKSLQFHPRKSSSTVYYCQVGWNGTGTQPDWSGNGQAGTVTGATVSAHVPLAWPFGQRKRGPYVVAAYLPPRRGEPWPAFWGDLGQANCG